MKSSKSILITLFGLVQWHCRENWPRIALATNSSTSARVDTIHSGIESLAQPYPPIRIRSGSNESAPSAY